MEWFALYSFILILVMNRVLNTQTGTVERIYIHDNKPALKGSNIQFVCDISQFEAQVGVFKTDSRLPDSVSGIQTLTFCIPSLCLTTTNGRYTFSADSSKIYINITNVNRSEDQKWWACADGNQRKDLQLTVLTVPQTLQYDSPPSQDQDLAQNTVTLKCSTGCSYPQPSFTWYYTESEGSQQVWSSSSASVTNKAGGCADSERIYTSTLSLARYTTFSGNIEKTVKFVCGIPSFTGMSQPLYTNSSVNIQFAVRVTSVTLKDGTSTPSNSLQVVSGVSKTLTCTTSISRPAATIVWYIGTVEKQRSSSSFTFTPQDGDHNKQIYCKAFNTQPESQAVSSNKATLDVQVRVSSVTLKDGTSTASGELQVVSGVSKTLTCVTSTSRPVATIVWYIGTVEKQRSSSNFTFTPQNSDHNKQIYCKAFNTQPESQAVSSNKATLYVQVFATTPTITNQTTGSRVMLENDPVTLECTSSQTRPVATVTWKKGSAPLTNVNKTNVTHTGGLVSVRSVVTFTPNRADNNEIISCQTFVPSQENKPQVQQKIVVHWPPSTPTIPTSDFPFLEGQTKKSVRCYSNEYGNPSSSATWNSIYGTQDGSNSRRLILPTLTPQQDGTPVSCQLKNSFTLAKGSVVESPVIKLQVEYTPIVQIMEGENTIQSITRNEGQEFSAFCNATGNPTPTVRWIGQTPNSAYLRFDDIDRTNHGTYKCKAEATSSKYIHHDFVTEKNLNITVNYAPDVTVVISNSEPTENTSLQISCKASGRPNIYTYTSMVQTLGGVPIPNTHGPRDGIIDIQKLQLQDSGTYTCVVNNGIRDRDQQLDQTGNTNVLVKVSPKVLLEGKYTFAGVPGKSVNITVPFYSNPAIRDVKFRFQNGTEIQNSNKHEVSYTRRNVTAKFYGTPVELVGYICVLRIKDEEESDFVNYTLILDNGMGQPQQWILHHVSESIPLIPKSIVYNGSVDGVPTFLLFGNFNGGRQQTFVIETSIDGSNDWTERLRFTETDTDFIRETARVKLTFKFNITGLAPNVYNVRVLAGNKLGWINESLAPTTQFTVLKPEKEPEGKTSPVGAIAGAAAGVLVAAIVVVAVVIILKKRTKRKGESATALHGGHHENEGDSSDDEVMTENLAYVSADEVGISKLGSVPDNLYTKPEKRDKKAVVQKGENEDPSSLYAVPDKKGLKNQKKEAEKGKQGKGAKKGKTKQNKNDDVYENASELTTVSKAKGRKGAYEENPYENPEESKPKINRNKDGLIYADLTFNDQPKGQKKLVIHGLDSMTEYVEVDFTKKADPLPESDEETNDNK